MRSYLEILGVTISFTNIRKQDVRERRFGRVRAEKKTEGKRKKSGAFFWHGVDGRRRLQAVLRCWRRRASAARLCSSAYEPRRMRRCRVAAAAPSVPRWWLRLQNHRCSRQAAARAEELEGRSCAREVACSMRGVQRARRAASAARHAASEACSERGVQSVRRDRQSLWAERFVW